MHITCRTASINPLCKHAGARLPPRRLQAREQTSTDSCLAHCILSSSVDVCFRVQARDFRLVGCAHESDLLPDWRRAAVNPERNSQLYMKRIEAHTPDMRKPGQRVGY
jgi:hypothetical protein